MFDAAQGDYVDYTRAEEDASFRTMPTELQISNLQQALGEASDIIASLQLRGAIQDVQSNSTILSHINNIATPILALPIKATIESHLQIQKNLQKLQSDIEKNTRSIMAKMDETLNEIRDTKSRVAKLEEPTARLGLHSANNNTSPKHLPNSGTKAPTAATAMVQKPEQARANPSAAHHPSRLIIQIQPDGIREEDRKDPQQLVSSINNALNTNTRSKHLRVVAAKYNAQGNLILSTRADQTAAELLKYADTFLPIIRDNKYDVLAREDKKWYKIQVDGMSTRRVTIEGKIGVHKPEGVHRELIACNPIYAANERHLISLPRWMRTQEELLNTNRSSVVFAVDDETVAKAILNTRTLAAFGQHCTLRAYQDRPPITQCKNCWNWDHKTDTCKNPTRCRICAKDHSEENHQEEPCTRCDAMDMSGDNNMRDGTSCLHNLRCTNCITGGIEDNNHVANSRRCPTRLEKYRSARDNERRAQKTGNPWKVITRKPKRSKTAKKALEAPPATVVADANPFDILRFETNSMTSNHSFTDSRGLNSSTWVVN